MRSRTSDVKSLAAPSREYCENLTDPFDGFLLKHRYVIHDRGPLFTARFADLLRDAGVKTLKLLAHTPNLNAFAERFVGSIRRECLDHIIPLGEPHLRRVVQEFVEHYNAEPSSPRSRQQTDRARTDAPQ